LNCELKEKETETEDPDQGLIIVGIGASAGGLEAFKSFFSKMPADSGMAFVLIQHLAPDYPTMLVEIIGKTTAMPVSEAKDGIEVVANHVYIIPPNATLTLEKTRLLVTSPAPPRAFRYPIDTFLFSLAQEMGEQACCIILAGTGTDGSLGLTAIKEQGGITFAQAELDNSPMSGMPKSAYGTGNVDHVLQVEDIPSMLMDYKNHLRVVEPHKDKNGSRRDISQYLPQIFAQLRTGIGHDFSHYKEKTLIRRIQRRMQVLQLNDPLDFINTLKQEPKELELLFQDLLISVTEFFRDTDAFLALEEQIIPKLLEGKGADSQVRIWVAACATGEEAYSIAILLAEALEKLSAKPKVVIFATDIDDKALSQARSGRYFKSHLEGVSPKRLSRWFFQEGEQYCVVPQIREMCIFSSHSVVKDPPFSRLDLLSCRNLLIYFNVALQDRLLPIFHYALKSDGILFLGSSEGIGRRSDLFATLDEKHRLFKRLSEAQANATLPFYPLFHERIRESFKKTGFINEEKAHTFERGARRVLARYSPTHVVIDRGHQILSFSGQTGKFLDPSPGAASLDFFHLIQGALRPTVRILLQKAFNSQQRVIKENIPFEVNGVSESVTLIVEPIIQASGEAQHYIVVFQQVDDSSEKMEVDTSSDGKSMEVQLLENELRITRERLKAALDETDEATEDLKLSNEEFQSMNEELHSSNEELETSKEEMQSINEELQTVNAELSHKNQMLIQVNSDIQNFFESTQIATLFLDENLCVRNFTPTITELFHLRESDKGRRITEVANRLDYDELENDAKETLQSMRVIEREVLLAELNATFVMKIQPYRTNAKMIEGVVITFVDISDRKRNEVALKAAKEEAETANAKKDDFLSMMSHELRTPLNAIIGYARMMETGRGGPLTEKQAKYLQNIAASGTHLLTIINDLLDLSKIEAGKMNVTYECVDIIPLMDDVKSMMSELAQLKKVQLLFEVPLDIGTLESDPARIKQIMINLISNAIKFNRSEKGSVWVRLSRNTETQKLLVEVQDVGIGIPPEKISMLFQKFTQVDNSAGRQHEGTGLGLALTKELIALHGGDITVESEVGAGTTFRFWLPLKQTTEIKELEEPDDET
jgi:two-component system CheB/CheR fusion protein